MLINKRGMFAVRIARNLEGRTAEERKEFLSAYSPESRKLIEYAAKTLRQQAILKGLQR